MILSLLEEVLFKLFLVLVPFYDATSIKSNSQTFLYNVHKVKVTTYVRSLLTFIFSYTFYGPFCHFFMVQLLIMDRFSVKNNKIFSI